MSDQPVLFSRAAASCRLTLNREDKQSGGFLPPDIEP